MVVVTTDNERPDAGEPSFTEADANDLLRRMRRLRVRTWLTLGLSVLILVPGVVGITTSVFYERFPEKQVASCTVAGNDNTVVRRSVLRARMVTDCGRFRTAKNIECVADSSQQVRLVPGATYDLVVRGPRIPWLSAPTIVGAEVTAEQPAANDLGPTEVDASASDAVQKVQQMRLPETLRAFDYEQPPFNPACDARRTVMTTAGLQFVSPARAEQLLSPPDGVTPKDPLLACEGYPCTDPWGSS